MNDWVVAGIAVLGTVAALGGGSWIVNLFRGKGSRPAPKE